MQGKGVLAGVAGVLVIAALLFAWPTYRVWQQGQEGQARLARADQERRILVTQAQAERDAASLRAEAIRIMGKAAKDFPEYREQEFMASFGEALRDGHISQVVYVPTEAGIPIMEANRSKP